MKIIELLQQECGIGAARVVGMLTELWRYDNGVYQVCGKLNPRDYKSPYVLIRYNGPDEDLAVQAFLDNESGKSYEI